MKYAILLAMLLLMVGTVVGQAYLKGSYTFPEKCKVPSRIALANGIVLATCVGEKWSADYHEGFTVDSDENSQPSWPYIKKAEPKVDVPAIQENHPTGLMHCHGLADGSGIASCEPDTEKVLTCSDKKRVLLTSVDGSIHVCHKVNQ